MGGKPRVYLVSGLQGPLLLASFVTMDRLLQVSHLWNEDDPYTPRRVPVMRWVPWTPNIEGGLGFFGMSRHVALCLYVCSPCGLLELGEAVGYSFLCRTLSPKVPQRQRVVFSPHSC